MLRPLATHARWLVFLAFASLWPASCASDDSADGDDPTQIKKNKAGSGGAGSGGATGAGAKGGSTGFPSGSLGGGGKPSGTGGAPGAGAGGNPYGTGGNGFGGGLLFGGANQGGAGSSQGGSSQGGAGASQGGAGSSQGGAGASQGGAGNGTAGSGPAGSGPCVPVCGDRKCGPDPTGCGTSCGPCAGEAVCTSQGLCQEICKPTWSTPLPGVTGIGQIVIEGNRAHTVGNKSGEPWAGSLSLCTGAITQQTSSAVQGASSARLIGLTLANGTLHAVGDLTPQSGGDPGDGFYVNMSTSLQVLSAAPLYGTAAADELWAAGVGPSGNLWLGGTSNLGADPTGAWMVKGLAGTQKYCGFPASAAAGVGRAVAVDGSSIWIGGVTDAQGYLGRFDDASCGADDPCGCQRSAEIPVKIGATSTEVRALIAYKGTLYAAGFASDTGDTFGFVARVSPSTLQVEGTFRWNPTADFDAFLSIATDGARLFLGGGQGWKGESDLATAQGTILALPLGFSSSSPPDWSKIVPGARAFFGIDAGQGAIVATSSTGASSVLALRCSTDGECP